MYDQQFYTILPHHAHGPMKLSGVSSHGYATASIDLEESRQCSSDARSQTPF